MESGRPMSEFKEEGNKLRQKIQESEDRGGKVKPG